MLAVLPHKRDSCFRATGTETQDSPAPAANTTLMSHHDPATASSFMSPELAKLF
jgi:hypothetical protein